MDQVIKDGRALREPALVSDQAAARLDPTGFDPAREETWYRDHMRKRGFAFQGERVTFLNDNGHDFELEAAREIFTPGQMLVVESCDIGDWSSRYTFVGVAGRFNTVMFAPSDSDGSPEGRDAQRLDGEAATARAEGIAHPGAGQ